MVLEGNEQEFQSYVRPWGHLDIFLCYAVFIVIFLPCDVRRCFLHLLYRRERGKTLLGFSPRSGPPPCSETSGSPRRHRRDRRERVTVFRRDGFVQSALAVLDRLRRCHRTPPGSKTVFIDLPAVTFRGTPGDSARTGRPRSGPRWRGRRRAPRRGW